MKSFISDAISKAGPSGTPEKAQPYRAVSAEGAEELERILTSLKTNIMKIFGCGGS